MGGEPSGEIQKHEVVESDHSGTGSRELLGGDGLHVCRKEGGLLSTPHTPEGPGNLCQPWAKTGCSQLLEM